MLKIYVTGEANTGKTSIALYIAEALKGLGFDVEVIDEDYNAEVALSLLDRLAAIRGRDETLVVETRAVRRGCSPARPNIGISLTPQEAGALDKMEYVGDPILGDHCPSCGGISGAGHKPDCLFAAVLEKAGFGVTFDRRPPPEEPETRDYGATDVFGSRHQQQPSPPDGPPAWISDWHKEPEPSHPERECIGNPEDGRVACVQIYPRQEPWKWKGTWQGGETSWCIDAASAKSQVERVMEDRWKGGRL